jgi:hypothetical protein
MTQIILTSLIVFGAIVYAAFLLVKLFRKPAKKSHQDCAGCSSDCSNCPLADLSAFKKQS